MINFKAKHHPIVTLLGVIAHTDPNHTTGFTAEQELFVRIKAANVLLCLMETPVSDQVPMAVGSKFNAVAALSRVALEETAIETRGSGSKLRCTCRNRRRCGSKGGKGGKGSKSGGRKERDHKIDTITEEEGGDEKEGGKGGEEGEEGGEER